MSWDTGIAPPGLSIGDPAYPPPPGAGPPPDYYSGAPPAYPPFPTQGPMPPGPPTPQDGYGGPPAGGGYPPPPGGDQVPTFFPGAPPPGPPQWGQDQAPAYGGPPPGDYYSGAGGGMPPPPVDSWQQQPAPIAVGGETPYGDRGSYTRRKSLLIGISYRNSIRPLGGCINDVKNVRQFLVERYGFPTSPDAMVILTDEGREDAAHLPTKANIIRWMRWLVADARAGDSLFLHYSGHGGQTPDLGADGDEIDAMDETILPVDYEQAGQIVDDDMHEILVRHLPPGVRLTVIFDSCHSGTALDLPYVYDNRGNIVCSPEMIASAYGLGRPQQHAQQQQQFQQQQQQPSYYAPAPSSATTYYTTSSYQQQQQQPQVPTYNPTVQYHARKKKKFSKMFGDMLMGLTGWRGVEDDGGTTDRDYSYEAHVSKIAKADVLMFSGCSDEQTSADTSIQGVGRTGAMSYAFIATLRANPRGLTFAGLLGQMRDVLRGQSFGQVPQLSSSHPMDMGQPFYV